ncbi:unnamed protein product [Caenorhabditis auriculariae]|uniref:DNA polymerase II subunit 2 n=1 Tax=Caenorhabditis auriculariae TaxID=2777116 RepID=A0A8S1H929_9PELO|nr:unnamed protein product [Caenorhabditis auriculariae]
METFYYPTVGLRMEALSEADEKALRREITKTFQMHAFELKREAVNLCVQLFSKNDRAQRSRWMNTMIDVLRKQTLISPLVTEDVLRDILKQCRSKNVDNAGKLLNVFDAFTMDAYDYNVDLRKMVRRAKTKSVAARSESFSHSLRQRFLLVKQRAARCASLKQIKFTSIEVLLSSMKKLQSVVVLGMLTQQKADCYHIEDLTGSVEVEFNADTRFHHALFAEGTIAIYEGSYDGTVLLVNEVALVPVESADVTRKELASNENWFGGEEKLAFRCNDRLRAALIQHAEASIVFVADVFLDEDRVLKAMYSLLEGYSKIPPVCFVFCGNFCSKTRQPETMELLDRGFRWLANQLNEFSDSYRQTHFVFVPGPDDPYVDLVTPRPNLPSSLFEHVSAVVNCTFASNPARIQYASQEIVVFRSNLAEKMCRHTVNMVTPESIPSRLARTLLSQAHLCPLPNHISPTLPEFGHALALHPLPDVLVAADRFESFVENVAGSGAVVANPGSFSRSAFTFQVYYPQQGKKRVPRKNVRMSVKLCLLAVVFAVAAAICTANVATGRLSLRPSAGKRAVLLERRYVPIHKRSEADLLESRCGAGPQSELTSRLKVLNQEMSEIISVLEVCRMFSLEDDQYI